MSPQRPVPDSQSIGSQRIALSVAGLVLLVGLALTGLAFFWMHDAIQRQTSERFGQLVDRVRTDVEGRLNAPLLGLRGAAGVYAASNTVERAEFRAYVHFSQLARNFPGVQGFGFLAHVKRDGLDRFAAAERADDDPAFTVRSVPGDADLYVVKFMEPRAGNETALGVDVGADPVYRRAVERAITTGEPALSRKISMAQDRHQSPGWVYLLPVYRVGARQRTPEERQAALIGVLFAPMLVGDVLQGAALATQGQAEFELFDAEPMNAQTRVYAMDGPRTGAAAAPVPVRDAGRHLSATRSVVAGGRTLTLVVSTTPAFEARAATVMPTLLGLGGAVLSLLLALCIWLLGSSRARALSEARRMTQSLAREQQRLLSIVEGTNVGTWEWNVQTGETRLDGRWAGITGHVLEDLLPLDIQAWRAMTHPGDLVRTDGPLQQHLEGKTPYFDCEVRMRHKDGHWVWVLVRGRVSVRTDDGKPVLMAGTLMDITERRTAELALRNSEEHFRQLFETSLECILQTRPNGQVLHANPAACELFGLSVEELRERGRGKLVDPTDTRLQALLDERQREGHVRGELRMLRGDGSPFECELSSSVFLDSDNQPRANIVLRDISARKHAEARIARLNAELEQRVGRRTIQLEASNRDLQEFAHSVAHDLRQPFIAIGGFSGLLERTVTDARAKHYIDRIKAGVRQAGELTEALLALANLSRVRLRVQTVDLSAIAHEVMDDLLQLEPARLHNITIQEGLVVQGDPILLRLVMKELLGNAWKFTSRQKHTEISFGLQSAPAHITGAQVAYVVRDNGEGFDMAHVDKLFRSFQRLHAPQEFPGAGVGLANIQRIVARHGGQIRAESFPGEGASFFFTLGSQSS